MAKNEGFINIIISLDIFSLKKNDTNSENKAKNLKDKNIRK